MRQNQWPEVKLGDHVDLLSGFAFKSKNFTNNLDDIPLVKGANVHQGYIDWEAAVRWPKEEFEDHDKFQLQENDVVLAMDRPWIEAGLKYSWIKKGDPKSLLVQRVSRLRGVNGLSSRYLRYVIGSPQFTSYIKPIVTGVNVPHISGGQIKDYRFPLPPEDYQDSVTDILEAYDNLIENNNRRIGILEEMAKSVYREWFVKFCFPGHENIKFIDSPLGNIPEGWEVKLLQDTCEMILSGGTPKRKEPTYWKPEEIPWVKTKELLDGWVFDTEEKISTTGLNNSSAKLFPENTILMAIYAAPTVGRLGVLAVEAACNQAAVGLIPDVKYMDDVFLYYKLLEMRQYFNSLSQGAAQQNINVGKVKNAPFVLPDRDLIKLFFDYISPMRKNIRVLSKRNNNLKMQRDMLLPKVISGTINIKISKEFAV
ncbi:MAG: restriction endonuclease subunit S [Candidatus Thiodiazotropha sp.]